MRSMQRQQGIVYIIAPITILIFSVVFLAVFESFYGRYLHYVFRQQVDGAAKNALINLHNPNKHLLNYTKNFFVYYPVNGDDQNQVDIVLSSGRWHNQEFQAGLNPQNAVQLEAKLKGPYLVSVLTNVFQLSHELEYTVVMAADASDGQLKMVSYN